MLTISRRGNKLNNHMYQLAEKISWKEMDGLVIIVDLESGAYFSLNSTASDIWQAIVSGKTEEEVKKIISEKYEVEGETIDKDVSACIDSWLSENLIIKI